MNKSIPTYIVSDIISSIIKYLINGFNSITFGDLVSNCIVDEIMNYARVSKSCFNMVSIELSNNIDISNYSTLQRLMESHTQHSNNSFKLIKLKDSIKIFNHFDKLDDFIKNSNSSGSYKFIILESIDPLDFGKVILQLSSLPNNVQLYLLVTNGLEYILNGGLNNFGVQDLSKIKRITLDFAYSPALFNFIKANIKNIEYSDDKNYRFDCKFSFQTSLPSRLITIDDLVFSNPLPTFNFQDSDEPLIDRTPDPVVEPLSKLDSFSLDSSLDVLLYRIKENQINSQQPINTNENGSYIEYWNQIVQSLSNDKSLKSIQLNHSCNYDTSCTLCNGTLEGINPKVINQGFKAILQSENCKVKDLSLFLGKPESELDSIIAQGLSTNTSIKNLQISSLFIQPLVSQVLNINQTIRNLTIYVNEIEEIGTSLNLFNQHAQLFDLYSASFITLSRDILQIKQILSDQLSHSNLPISEINIICIFTDGCIYKKPDYCKIKYNNSNINLIYWSQSQTYNNKPST